MADSAPQDAILVSSEWSTARGLLTTPLKLPFHWDTIGLRQFVLNLPDTLVPKVWPQSRLLYPVLIIVHCTVRCGAQCGAVQCGAVPHFFQIQ
jgi:hypothetical protein